MLVLAALLVIVGATASGQAALVTADSSTTLLNSAVGADAAVVRSFVGLNLLEADLEPGGMTASRRATLQHGLALLVDRGGILHAALVAPDRTILVTDDGIGVGGPLPVTQGFTDAVQDQQADAAIVGPEAAGAVSTIETGSALREYFPIIEGGQVRAVVAIWRDAAPILQQLDAGRIHVVVITLTAALVSALLLVFIFRTAQNRLTRQSLQLLEAARLDPLTGTLNHGALVEILSERVEAARANGGAIGVAMLDVDNFGLLDDTHGHPAGDHALREVVRLLAEWMPAGATWGRYGPDEFLVITAIDDADILEPAVERLRTSLAELTLEFDGSDRLPVTISAGICVYPTNGASVTSLLSTTAVTLDEAKAGGGDAVRKADARPPTPGFLKTFDLLQSLVIVVDAKDRYTRRHSEDVARYADFLAGHLQLDPAVLRAIHTSGLLHDVGKIGIPDAILRKPGRLTDDEYAVVKQHVALGDAITRDLPGIDLIRQGIRFHHERWDGRGYLDELVADQIPLVARILAVADAFSAMTTTRPYRKAVSVEEAFRRLEDAAGSQLDPHLVDVFLGGMWTAVDPPLPGGTAPATPGIPLVGPRQVA